MLVDPGAVHVCYCHNPFRYAWTEREATVAARPVPLRLPLRVLLSRWRQWDWMAAQRVDRYVANSVLTAQRIHRYFGRDSEVLHPPVELQRFRPGPVGGYYLIVAELMAHKQIDVAVQAFNRLRAPLVVVGDGPELRRLRKLAGPTVRFTGRLPDARVAEMMRSARAMVVTAAEEFGIAAVESLASGRPVIALGAGGVLESVVEGQTGVYYRRNDPRDARRRGLAVRSGRVRSGRLRGRCAAFRQCQVPGRAARYRGRRGGGRPGRAAGEPARDGERSASPPSRPSRRGRPVNCNEVCSSSHESATAPHFGAISA